MHVDHRRQRQPRRSAADDQDVDFVRDCALCTGGRIALGRIGDPKAPRAWNAAISLHAEEIALRALRRKPSERYASVAALKADLDHPTGIRVTGLAAGSYKLQIDDTVVDLTG